MEVCFDLAHTRSIDPIFVDVGLTIACSNVPIILKFLLPPTQYSSGPMARFSDTYPMAICNATINKINPGVFTLGFLEYIVNAGNRWHTRRPSEY